MMGLSLQPRLLLLCKVCKTNAGDSEEHNPECPKAQIAKAVASNHIWQCAKCDGRCELTMDDYIQCRKCHQLYTTGFVAAGQDPMRLENTFLHQLQPTEDYQKVLVIPGKFKPRFRLDFQIKLIKYCKRGWKP